MKWPWAERWMKILDIVCFRDSLINWFILVVLCTRLQSVRLFWFWMRVSDAKRHTKFSDYICALEPVKYTFSIIRHTTILGLEASFSWITSKLLLRPCSTSSLTLTLNEWRFNLSFSWVSMLFLKSWRMSSHIVRYDTNPPAIQKQQWHSREAQIELPLIQCRCEWAFRIRSLDSIRPIYRGSQAMELFVG